jgi:uncharacterized protein DUF4386
LLPTSSCARLISYLYSQSLCDALAMLLINLHNHGFGVAEIFWGLWLFPLGLLMYRSRFLPQFLGVRLAIGSFANVILSLRGLLLPEYQHKVFTYSQPAFFREGRRRSCCGSSSRAPGRQRWTRRPYDRRRVGLHFVDCRPSGDKKPVPGCCQHTQSAHREPPALKRFDARHQQ